MNRGWTLVIGFTVLLLVALPATRAEEVSNADLLSRIETLESQLEQRSQFALYSMGDQETAFPTDLYGEAASVSACSSSNLYAGYELTVLRPWVGNANDFGAGFSDDYGYGHRFTLGYSNCTGIGARMRYWFYNHGHDVVPPKFGPDIFSFDMDVVDLEMTLNGEFCNWELLVSGGVRYGRLGIDWVPFDQHVDFEGVGPTVALEARRQAGCRGLYLVGNFRSSVLLGQISNADFLLGTGGGSVPAMVDDEVALVLENQLGIGWTRGVLDLRAVWETQLWMNDTFADDFNGFGTNFTFGGLALQAGLRY